MAAEGTESAAATASPATVAPTAETTAAPVTVIDTAASGLIKLSGELPSIFVESEGHKEMWGVELVDESHVPTTVVLQKFLRANNGDVSLARQQLVKALLWRKQINPGKLLDEMDFSKCKFGDLGYVTTHKGRDNKEVVITWNIYGAVKDVKATFGDLEEFIKWRAALMELGVRKLNLASVETPIPENGQDPYQMIQVHDYQNVSFFRLDSAVKAASKETIQIFSMAYPELLAHKYFVNVPAIMGFIYAAMKLFVSAATRSKFHPMASGASLAAEVPNIKESLPKEYGGSGTTVKDGETVRLVDLREQTVEPQDANQSDKDGDAEVKETSDSGNVAPLVENSSSPEPAMDTVPLTDSSTANKPVVTEGSSTLAENANPVPGVSALALQDVPEEEKKPGVTTTST